MRFDIAEDLTSPGNFSICSLAGAKVPRTGELKVSFPTGEENRLPAQQFSLKTRSLDR